MCTLKEPKRNSLRALLDYSLSVPAADGYEYSHDIAAE